MTHMPVRGSSRRKRTPVGPQLRLVRSGRNQLRLVRQGLLQRTVTDLAAAVLATVQARRLLHAGITRPSSESSTHTPR